MKKLLLSLVTLVLLVPAGAKTDLSKYVIVYPAAAGGGMGLPAGHHPPLAILCKTELL